MQTIIVTGAANGIGAAVVRDCVAAGFHVVGCDIDHDGLKRLASTLPNSAFLHRTVDVSDIEEVRRFFQQVKADFGSSLFGLVNNAGVYHGRSIYAYSDIEIDEIIRINVISLIHLSKDFASALKERGLRGSIVNITSVAGEVGSSDAMYGLTKAAVIGLTKSNAMNFAPYVRVNAVSPALIRNTSIYPKIPDYRLAEYHRQETLDIPIDPEGVSGSILFLLSKASQHITGKILPVDNGAYPR